MSDDGNTAPREMKQRREVEWEERGGAESNVGAVGAVQKVLSSWLRDEYGSKLHSALLGGARRAALSAEP